MIDAPPQMDTAYVERVVSRAVACGIPRTRVTVTYSVDLQNHELAIRADGTAIDAVKMRCLVDVALETGVDVSFDPPELYAGYAQALEEHPRIRTSVDQLRADAREALRQQGLLESLPIYDPAREGLDAFARRIERFSGLEAGSMLRVQDGRLLLVPRDPASLTYEDFIRVHRALLAQPGDLTPVALVGMDGP